MVAHFSQLSTIIFSIFYYYQYFFQSWRKQFEKLYGMNNVTQYQYITICRLYEKLSTKFHYNILPMSFWEMILEANNPALVQNARPLAEGIVHSLRNIPRRGSNVVIVPALWSASPIHTEHAVVYLILSLIAIRAEQPQSKNDQTPRQCLQTHISETSTSVNCNTCVEHGKSSKIIGTQIIGTAALSTRRTLSSTNVAKNHQRHGHFGKFTVLFFFF